MSSTPTRPTTASTDLTDIEEVADLAVTKTDNVTSLIPGNAVAYDIAVVNNGPSAVSGATLTDAIPAAHHRCQLDVLARTWHDLRLGSGSGDVSVDVDLAVGASLVVHVTGTVSPSAVGTLVNTAVIAPPAGVTDPNGVNNSASDSDSLNPVADVSVAKSNGVVSQSPGATSSYIITVANAGPSAAAGVAIVDPLPTGVSNVSWTCSAGAGSACAAASGTGAINTTVDLAATGTVTFTVSLQAGASAGTLTNTVTATVPPGINDPDPSNNVASDTDTLVFTADIAVAKWRPSAPSPPANPSTTPSWSPTTGPTRRPASTFSTPCLPGSSAPRGRARRRLARRAPPTVPATSRPPSTSLPAARRRSAVNTTATTAAPSTIVNTATAAVGPDTVDPNPSNNSASATVTIDFTSSLSIHKTASVSTALPGDTFTYTIVASNAGPAGLNGVLVSDPVPSGLVAQSWTCTGAAGGVCDVASGTGSPLVHADLPLGGSVTILLTVQVTAGASGPILNVATASASLSGASLSAQASANIVVSPVVPPTAALSITKTTRRPPSRRSEALSRSR